MLPHRGRAGKSGLAGDAIHCLSRRFEQHLRLLQTLPQQPFAKGRTRAQTKFPAKGSATHAGMRRELIEA